MNKNIAIKVENLSKAYQLGQIGTGTISRDLERFWTTRIRGKEDPFLKIGQTNDRTVKGESDIVWSLKDIDFEIEQGDAVGIIGRNGAGKSTLLKLLSRVTAPTTGNIKIKGRIASLLEVGTGFHPELTGRENIYLNGAILGMRKNEITRKFDEIVDFSGVERYIDTPVKRYSSGMYVRLAFAVAAHLESEILIVDEVLAVGDAEFQTKCLGKMGEVSKGEGRTVLFVSHNMDAIVKLCNQLILFNEGMVIHNGEIQKGIDKYFEKTNHILEVNKKYELSLRKLNLQLDELLFTVNNKFSTGKKLNIILKISNRVDFPLNKIRISVAFYESEKLKLILDNSMCNYNIDLKLCEDKIIEFQLDSFPLGEGIYDLVIYMESEFGEELIFNKFQVHCISNDIFENNTFLRPEWPKNITYSKFKLTIKRI